MNRIDQRLEQIKWERREQFWLELLEEIRKLARNSVAKEFLVGPPKGSWSDLGL